MLNELRDAVRNALAARLVAPMVYDRAFVMHSLFSGQHSNPKRNAERKAMHQLGRRQYLKTRKALKRGMQ